MDTSQRIFSRREVEALIAAGDTIVLKENAVLRLNSWKDVHPGGDLVIQHMATQSISTFEPGHDVENFSLSNADISCAYRSHPREIVEKMQRYRIGIVRGAWENFTPPIQGGLFRVHGDDSGVDGESKLKKEKDFENSDNVGPLLSADDYTTSQVQRNIAVDLAKYPSLDPATQHDITLRFEALHKRVHDEGFYTCHYSQYGKELLRYAVLFALFAIFLRRGNFVASGCFLGLFWHLIMFSAHDAGHRSITQNLTVDTLIGIFIANVCCGLSIGWWKRSHNVHHLVTNFPEHDPDIQNVPLFATSPSFFSSLKSSYYGSYFPWDAFATIAVGYQKYTYYPVMIFARFNLYFLSWSHLLSKSSHNKGSTWWTRPTEIAGIMVYIIVFFYGLLYGCIPTWWSRLGFLLASHMMTGLLHVQITLSHWGTSTADLGPAESFAQRQLRTTMDIECPTWLDFIHGGLQFQAVHHLFPRVPRHNNRRLQSLVKEFCAETGIEYLSYGFTNGNCIVLNKLAEVADQARMLAVCQANVAAVGKL